MICRFDNSGLGTLSWEFARHLKPHKVLLVENHVHATFPERYADFDTCRAVREIPDDFLDDIDVLLTFETFYDWGVIKRCRERGIKTVLYTMYEMTPDPIPLHPDLYLCPSTLDFDVMPDPKVYLPVPVATDRLRWRERTTAKTFVHTASHGGVSGRKGTQLLLDAMEDVESDIDIHIYSWKPFTCADPRVKIKVVNFKNYWQAWREGDVLIYPQDYNGICLPVVEAMASGLAVISTDIYPFNEFLPKELLFGHDGLYKTRAAPQLLETEAAKMNPKKIANKIDEYANRPIQEFSNYGRTWANKNNWDTLLPRYQAVLEGIHNNLEVSSLQKL